jgi:hypothetical protein
VACAVQLAHAWGDVQLPASKTLLSSVHLSNLSASLPGCHCVPVTAMLAAVRCLH